MDDVSRQVDIQQNNEDAVRPFVIPDLDIRGRVVHLDVALNNILERHKYPSKVSSLLGQAMTLTSLVATALKLDGRLTLQTRSDGPVSMMIVDFDTPSAVRAYASFDEEKLSSLNDEGNGTPELLLGNGHLAITIDHRQNKDRYQGIVALGGRSLEEIADRYFEQSEQIPTRIRLAMSKLFQSNGNGPPSERWRAGGVMVQYLPEDLSSIPSRDLNPGDGSGENEERHIIADAWQEASALVDTILDHELTDPLVSTDRLLTRLFNEHDVRIFKTRSIKDECRCSQDRVKTMLHSIGPDELSDMIDDGVISVTCEFCSTEYTFDAKHDL